MKIFYPLGLMLCWVICQAGAVSLVLLMTMGLANGWAAAFSILFLFMLGLTFMGGLLSWEKKEYGPENR